ncbi:MAG: putative glycosyltransferase [Ilumatobacteraceae bacterium]|jgi:glycosyltransferase involved in cell wall biosynthesis|nr:putative glycosyltransferase [Ilumatobacteraceae bacterium]
MTGASIEELAAEMIAAGARRVHVLAWRDLDDADAGGSEVHADQFMRRAAAAGLEITQRTSAAVGLPHTAARNGYRVIRRGSRYTVFPRAVASEIAGRMGPFDALVEVWNGVPWMAPVWTRKPRITFLHHIHGPMWDQLLPGPLAHLGRALESRLAPPFYRRGLTLTPSEATRLDLLGLGFRPDRVVAVNNGVDEFFEPGGERSTDPLVVCVGRLAPVKRQEEVIEAAVAARRRVPCLRLVIAGDGPMEPLLRERIAAHGAGDWIHLAGRLDRRQLVDLYRAAWLVTSASLAEGWGLTLTEAAACGTPGVATDVSGHRSSVVDGVTGVLVPLDRLGTTLADVLLDEPRRTALAAAALTRARTLTWEASATGILSALRDQVVARSVRQQARR